MFCVLCFVLWFGLGFWVFGFFGVLGFWFFWGGFGFLSFGFVVSGCGLCSWYFVLHHEKILTIDDVNNVINFYKSDAQMERA
jgi:hypothetical protein